MRSCSALLVLSLALLASALDHRAHHPPSGDAVLAKRQSVLTKDIAHLSSALSAQDKQATALRASIKKAHGNPSRQKPYQVKLGAVKRAMSSESAKLSKDQKELKKVMASRRALSSTTSKVSTATKASTMTTTSKPKTSSKPHSTSTKKATTSSKKTTTNSPTSSKAAPQPTSTAPIPKPTGGATTSVKKGLGYNTASYTNAFGNSISWAYNWADQSGKETGNLLPTVTYIPMLWGASTTGFSIAAASAVSSGATFILGMNEPDHSQQANLRPTDAAKMWKEQMEPLRSDTVKLVSPAITNGGNPMGVAWMAAFIEACDGCHIDAIAAHWYDSATNVAYFHNYFTNMSKKFGRPLWITEFAGSGTVAEQQKFLEDVVPWMEKQSFVQRYAAFGAFAGTFVNSDGSLTALGTTYKNTV